MKKFRFLNLLICAAMLVNLLCLPVAAADAGSDETDATEETVPEITEPVLSLAPSGDIPANTGADASVSNGCHTLDAMVPLAGSEKRLETATSAILYEYDSDTMLYSYQPDERVYPASLVKIMTALIALEKGNLEQEITITQSALSAVPAGALIYGLMAGQVYTLQDLLNFMMLISANDACAVIAETIAGDQAAFVTEMNRRAKEIGCTGTNFTNPTGVHEEQQYTTARDMAKILYTALQNPDFVTIFGTKVYEVPGEKEGEYKSVITNNHFMTRESGVWRLYDRRVTGGKNGAISDADRSIVCTAASGDIRVMCIVMSAKGTVDDNGYSLKRMGDYEEAAELFEFGLSSFEVSQILNSDKAVGQFTVANGENQVISRAEQSVSSAIPFGAKAENLTWQYVRDENALTAPIEAESSVGMVRVWFGNVCVAQANLMAMHDVRVGSGMPVVQDTDPAEIDSTINWDLILKILGILFACILLVVVLLFAVRWIRRWIIRARRRRRRMNRRRSR